MSTKNKNLSDYRAEDIPSASGFTFGIAVSDWNSQVTGTMLKGAVSTLLDCGAADADIHIHHVPGSFELPLGAQLIEECYHPDAILCIGCVIQGETRHFDYICSGVTEGIAQLNLKYGKPFIFGVLTTQNLEQALARAGGRHGNKGVEAALTAIKMVSLNKQLSR
jgi:6,7-dimethyl-8-ribityllumazine synthase